jgi:tape measure domain-containing protein
MPIGELSDIYGKMKVSGRITMEDMNQLGGRGVPIYQALSKTMGVAKSEIRGMVEQGKVGFPDIEKAFVDMTKKGSMFGGMMDKQSRSFSGLWSTLADNANMLFGQVMKPAFDWLTKEGLPKAIALVGKFGEGFKTGGLRGGLAAVLGADRANQILGTLNAVKGVVLGILGVVGGIAKAFMSLPGVIQKVIIAVGLLAAATKLLGLGGVATGIAGRVAGAAVGGGAGAAGALAPAAGGLAAAAGAAAIPVAIIAISAAAGYVLGKAFIANEKARGGTKAGNTFGTLNKAAAGTVPALDTKPAEASIAVLEARIQKWRDKVTMRLASGEMDNQKWLDKIAEADKKVDALRNAVRYPFAAGHLKNSKWLTPTEQAQRKVAYFRSLVALPIAVGHMNTSGITGPLQNALAYFKTVKWTMENSPISSHINIYRTTISSAQTSHIPKPHSGGVFSGPHSGYAAIMHGREAVLPLEHPNLIPGILAKAGLTGKGVGGDGGSLGLAYGGPQVIQNDIYLDGELIASQALNLAEQSEARSGRGHA